jgi:hypothetical protein
LKFSLEEYAVNGRCLWLGLIDNVVVSTCMYLTGKDCQLLSCKDNEVAISQCETHVTCCGCFRYARNQKNKTRAGKSKRWDSVFLY